jgi:hypothetical protein
MNDPLRYAFVVEVEDFLPKVEIFEERWSAGTDLQGVLVVRNRASLGCRQDWNFT